MTLTNATAQEKRRLEIKVGIGYGSDLKKAKEIHDELESYYINAMDFGKVSAVADSLITRIKASKN